MMKMILVSAVSVLVLFTQVSDGLDMSHVLSMSLLQSIQRDDNMAATLNAIAPSQRIIGGSPAVRGQIPHQAAIFLTRDNLTYFCGGSAISLRYVLTAAHCAYNVSEFTVLLGAINLTDGAEPSRQMFRVSGDAAVVHANYSTWNKLNDIALIKLPRDLLITEYVRPIRMPSRTQKAENVTFENCTATLSGWGRVSDASTEISLQLMSAPVIVMGNPLCTLYFLAALYAISPTHICNGAALGTNACSGDSGGPLTVIDVDGELTQVGLVSLGFSKCESGWPTAHTRLTHFLDFIEDNSDVIIRQ